MFDVQPPGPSPAPGWYPDPKLGVQRWWDGEQWAGLAPPVMNQRPVWNGAALTALVLGLLTVGSVASLYFWVFAVPLGLVGSAVGILGIANSRARGERAMAWWGLALSALPLLLGLVWLVGLLMGDAPGGDPLEGQFLGVVNAFGASRRGRHRRWNGTVPSVESSTAARLSTS
jgi:hypothetical protein